MCTMAFPCLDLLAVDACLYLFAKTLLLAFVLGLVLVVQPSKICNFRSTLTKLLFLYAIVFSLGKGQPRDVVCQLLFLV